MRADIANFLSGHVRPDGTYAINNPFRYALSAPVNVVHGETWNWQG